MTIVKTGPQCCIARPETLRELLHLALRPGWRWHRAYWLPGWWWIYRGRNG